MLRYRAAVIGTAACFWQFCNFAEWLFTQKAYSCHGCSDMEAIQWAVHSLKFAPKLVALADHICTKIFAQSPEGFDGVHLRVEGDAMQAGFVAAVAGNSSMEVMHAWRYLGIGDKPINLKASNQITMLSCKTSNGQCASTHQHCLCRRS